MLPACGLMDQVTPEVAFVKAAVNCCVCPVESVALAGETVTVMAGGCSVMVAAPVAVGSKTLAAVTVTFWLAEIAAGAVYRPLDGLMEPTCGLMLQVTPVWLMPLTFAENCCVCPAPSVAADGLTTTIMMTGTSVMDTDAACVGSATLVAVAVTVCPVEMKLGAL